MRSCVQLTAAEAVANLETIGQAVSGFTRSLPPPCHHKRMANVRHMYVWCVLSVLTACGPVYGNDPAQEPASTALSVDEMDWTADPTELAIQRYESVRGPVGVRCQAYVRSMTFTWVSTKEEMADVCNSGTRELLGCTAYTKDGDPMAYVRTDVCNDVLVHEAIHIIGQCDNNDSDSDHGERDLWQDMIGQQPASNPACSAKTLYARPFDNAKQGVK